MEPGTGEKKQRKPQRGRPGKENGGTGNMEPGTGEKKQTISGTDPKMG